MVEKSYCNNNTGECYKLCDGRLYKYDLWLWSLNTPARYREMCRSEIWRDAFAQKILEENK